MGRAPRSAGREKSGEPVGGECMCVVAQANDWPSRRCIHDDDMRQAHNVRVGKWYYIIA